MSRMKRSVASVAVAVVLVLLAGGHPAPVQSQTAPRKLDLAHIIAPPESGAIGFKYLAEEVTKRSNGQLNVVFHGGTLLSKELEIMDAVKSGNVAIGTPGRRGLHGVSRDVRVPHAVPGARLQPRLLDVQRRDRQEPRRDVPEEVQGQDPVLLRLRVPSLLEQPQADQHAGRSQGPEDARAAGPRLRRHRQRPRGQRGADAVGRGDAGRPAGRHRRRRPAHLQHQRAQGLRGLEVRLDDLPQLRAHRCW